LIYGLIGASGTGKTTLAKLVAEAMDITYVPSSITECARKHGFDSVGKLTLTERVELQKHLLDDHVEMISQTKRPMITDRTPIDMAGYMLAEFNMHSHEQMSFGELKLVDEYSYLCRQAVVQNYDHVFMLGRLPVYEVSSTRPSVNPAYQRHTELIMRGLIAELGMDIGYSIIESETLHFRQDFVVEKIAERLDDLEMYRRKNRSVC
jgi:ABC-type oligopeptide transport system ATPase subunit